MPAYNTSMLDGRCAHAQTNTTLASYSCPVFIGAGAAIKYVSSRGKGSWCSPELSVYTPAVTHCIQPRLTPPPDEPTSEADGGEQAAKRQKPATKEACATKEGVRALLQAVRGPHVHTVTGGLRKALGKRADA